MNIVKQIRDDLKNGVLIGPFTWAKLLDYAEETERKNIDLQRLYDERGNQIKWLDTAIDRQQDQRTVNVPEEKLVMNVPRHYEMSEALAYSSGFNDCRAEVLYMNGGEE